MVAGGAVRRRGRGFQNAAGVYNKLYSFYRCYKVSWLGLEGNDGAVTAEPKYDRLDTTKDGDTKAARCEHHSPAL